ncbi:unnamed protein product [Phytophthora fragariaefolia]|uniref:Unnamed protein product n=1 Tax=Phytophthora fragariaefolia TaxID=1490495 RepID=A0A9W6U173_9STRA|nr:unnamed protein product [Phytophthora fragariaefolia]
MFYRAVACANFEVPRYKNPIWRNWKAPNPLWTSSAWTIGPPFDDAFLGGTTVPAAFTRADVELATDLTDLTAQASAFTMMAAQTQLRARRGWQTSGRGDCPVPGNVGRIPGAASLGLAGDVPPPRPPGENTDSQMPTTANGYTPGTALPVPGTTSPLDVPRR